MYSAPLPSPQAIRSLKSVVHESIAHNLLMHANEQSTFCVFIFHIFTVESVDPDNI